ncbi:MAG: hypothetical protein RL172_1259 [Bacteroidota bacterium]
MVDEQQTTSFLQLLEQHKGIVIKVASMYATGFNSKDDLVQEIIYQLWRSYPTYNQQYRFTTWMYRVSLNVAISFYRQEKRNAINRVLLPVAEDTTDECNLQQQEQAKLLQKYIALLKPLDKALLLLYFEEKTYKEMAEVLGITETNVATRLSRVKEKLKQQIEKEIKY